MAVLELVTKPRTGFVYLAHLLMASRANAIAKLRIAGITLIPTTKRVYPRSWAASQVLGTVGWDGHGTSGLEYRYNSDLRGTNGDRRIVNDAIGQPISIDDVRSTVPGKTMALTIDAALQDEVEQVLAGVGAKFQPKGATAIVMNPNNGAILALANWPRINANDPSSAPSYASEDRAVGFNYEPGSTFKAITISGALQDGARLPEHRVQRATVPAGRRPPDPRRRDSRRGAAVGRPDPQGLQQHRRRRDRDEDRGQAL